MRYLFLLIIFLPLCVSGQVNIDSLKTVWNDDTKLDTVRLEALQAIIWQGYLFSQPDSAIYFIDLQYNFAAESGHDIYRAMAQNSRGVAKANKGDFEDALKCFESSKVISEELGDELAVASDLNNMGLVYDWQGNYAEAIAVYEESLRLRKKHNATPEVAISLTNIGAIYFKQGDLPRALEFFLDGLKVQEEVGDTKTEAASLNNIAGVYFKMDNLDKALEFYQRSLTLREADNDRRGIASVHANIGKVYYAQNNDSLALLQYQKSIEISKELENKSGVSLALSNIAQMVFENGELDEALKLYEECLRINEEIGDRRRISTNLVSIGLVQKAKGNLSKAIKLGKKSLSITQEINILEGTREAAHLLYQCYKAQGNQGKALEMYELHVAIRDTIQNEENKESVIRQEFKYQYDKQAAADSVKNAEAQKLQEAEIEYQKALYEEQQQQNYYLYGGLAVTILLGLFVFNRFQVTRKQRDIIDEQKQEVEQQKAKVDEAYDQLEEKNKEVMDSISYAKRIQSAILPQQKEMQQYLPEHFVLYQPKDIVAGDFYWMEPVGENSPEKGVLFAAADCTGHGVPGALVSVVCNNALNRSVREYGLTKPGAILDKTREIVVEEFEKSEEQVKDGMDIALCHLVDNTLTFAGAYNPLWIIRNGSDTVEEIKGSKQPIGQFRASVPFETSAVSLHAGDTLYVFSDGFADQFGGDKQKKYKSPKFKTFLLAIQKYSMEKQQQLLRDEFKRWKRDLEQVDDICIIGIRI